MKHLTKTAIFYGSSGGTTGKVASIIANCIGNARIFNVESANKLDLESYDFLIFGIPTWGLGNLQMDWADFIKVVQKANLSEKTIALFGLGDQKNYPYSFCDALGILHDSLISKARIIGRWPATDYRFNRSKAFKNGTFDGLVIDEDNEQHLTKHRIEKWCEKIRYELTMEKYSMASLAV
jgi:flavodoxin I